ncbi:TPMT family class I SAM-dependent methyltransferase [Flavihumibacter rivuli]|uniref:methyltransferase domain-containing protein n=1 Tax=Flavihumibacter rivuli TaxID=2838156 RepID=UPI001BDE216D|nr:methyltransferase domain-containing protein [Flavihumibacter rivuli]ULQ57979.1 TPMT family class I SAM-dependent methyltransferase [Flavihumibacter rivuli]
MQLDAAYWNDRYLNHKTSWDIGYAAPALTHFVDQLPDKSISILVPGCGNGYEVEYLLQKGFTNVTVVDIAPSLTDALKRRLEPYSGKELTIITGDFFELDGLYDLVLEQTFFCALDPEKRADYANKMFNILKPGGKLAGVLFNREFIGGPPFGGSQEEYKKLFSKMFTIKVMEPCYNSITPRQGSEVFMILFKPV